MDLKRGRALEVWLTLLLWRACSSEAQKLKQRQGTPASLAHWMYLWRGKCCYRCHPALSPHPHPTPPQGSSTWPYLGHLDWCCQSQLASPASVLPGMSSHNAAMTPACPMGPRTGYSQSGESHPKNSAPREGTAPLTLFMWTYPAGNRCSWTKVDLPAVGKCGHQLESRNQMIAGGAGDSSGCGISPPGNPTVTTTSGLGLRRMLDSGM